MLYYTHVEDLGKMLLKQLAALFESRSVPSDSISPQAQAAAVLLLEVCYADFDIAQIELNEAASALAKIYRLKLSQAQAVLEQAVAEHQEITSIFSYTQLLNEHMSVEDKEKLLTALWRIARADKRILADEEHRIRKLAEQLHLPHKSFIRAKLNTEVKNV